MCIRGTCLAALSLWIGGLLAAGQDYDLSWYNIGGGEGMTSTGRSCSLSGAIGQPDASTGADSTSTGPNRFPVRVSGGTYIHSDASLGSGVCLTAGARAWFTISERAAKESYAAVRDHGLLERLAAIPVRIWSYKTQDRSIRHMGSMAQDLHAPFGIGEDDKRMSTVEAEGVAPAGVQALYQLAKGKEAEIAALRAKNVRINARHEKPEAGLAALEAVVARLDDASDRGRP
jgi:trimeric autotransporter adhesin